MFRMDVAKVDWDVASVSEACCECFRGMLQAFVQNVSYVSDLCCKRFLSECCTCFTPMLQEYVQNVAIVSVLCWNKCFHVAICKCFYLGVTYVSHILQFYVPNVSCVQRWRVLGTGGWARGEPWAAGRGAQRI